MSYILDALNKSSADAQPELASGLPPTPAPGLATPWKIAIGAVLAINLLLLYLWRTDRADSSPATASQPVQQDAVAGSTGARYPTPPAAQSNAPKKTLPGIASPRDLPPPRPAAASTSSTSNNQPRTFRPTGAPVTIAEPSAGQRVAAPVTAPQPAQAPRRSAPARRIEQRSDVSRLSQLSESARQALYVLTFSTHIFGSDADLRAVVVNGERQTEGNTITTAEGEEFLLLEIIDDGVILQFDHEGQTERVEIPVMEDWKDA